MSPRFLQTALEYLFSSLLHFHPTTSACGEINSCKLGVFRSHCFLLPFLRLIFNKHSQIGFKRRSVCLCAPECVFVCAHVYVSCCCSGICCFARACVSSRAASARDRTRGTESQWPAAIRWQCPSSPSRCCHCVFKIQDCGHSSCVADICRRFGSACCHFCSNCS